jgi:hypothetical protein
MLMDAQVQELSRKAQLCRRAARIPGSGSWNTDRILVVLADRLERDAALQERLSQEGAPVRLLKLGPVSP